MKKRFVSVILSLSILILSFPVVAFSSDLPTTDKNLALNSTILYEATEPIAVNEGAEKLFDGNVTSSKWCCQGNSSYIVFKTPERVLPKRMLLYHVLCSDDHGDKYHAPTLKNYELMVLKDEAAYLNITDNAAALTYLQDDANWKKVGGEENNTVREFKSTNLTLDGARSVYKIKVNDSGTDVIRLMELELYSTKAPDETNDLAFNSEVLFSSDVNPGDNVAQNLFDNRSGETKWHSDSNEGYVFFKTPKPCKPDVLRLYHINSGSPPRDYNSNAVTKAYIIEVLKNEAEYNAASDKNSYLNNRDNWQPIGSETNNTQGRYTDTPLDLAEERSIFSLLVYDGGSSVNIYDLRLFNYNEVYHEENVCENATVIGKSSEPVSYGERNELLVDGDFDGTKWCTPCSAEGEYTVLDVGHKSSVTSMLIHNAGAGAVESSKINTKACSLQVLDESFITEEEFLTKTDEEKNIIMSDNNMWLNVGSIENNYLDIVKTDVNLPSPRRIFRFFVSDAGWDNCIRIFELKLFGEAQLGTNLARNAEAIFWNVPLVDWSTGGYNLFDGDREKTKFAFHKEYNLGRNLDHYILIDIGVRANIDKMRLFLGGYRNNEENKINIRGYALQVLKKSALTEEEFLRKNFDERRSIGNNPDLWEDVVTVTDNETAVPINDVTMTGERRIFRFKVTNCGFSKICNIFELELFSDSFSAPKNEITNSALDAEILGVSNLPPNNREAPQFAFDGNRNETKWCTRVQNESGEWTGFKLSSPQEIRRMNVYHAGAGLKETVKNNTLDFELQILKTDKISEADFLNKTADEKQVIFGDGSYWQSVAVEGNNNVAVTKNFVDMPEKRQVFRFHVSNAGSDKVVRIYEIELYNSDFSSDFVEFNKDNIHKDDYLYIGESQHNFTGPNMPISWRILNKTPNGTNNGNPWNENAGYLLITENLLETVQLHTDDSELKSYTHSTLRSYLNGYGANMNIGGESGIDYTENNLMNKIFNVNERSLFLTTTLLDAKNDNNSSFQDKIFILSEEEALDRKYFKDNKDRTAERPNQYGGGEAAWWLRYTIMPNDDAGCECEYDGFVNTKKGQGTYATYDRLHLRPALNLDISKLLFFSTPENNNELGLQKGPYHKTDKRWKLTFLDSNRNFSVNETKITADAGEPVSINFNNALVGENEYISAIIIDGNGKGLFRGRIAKPQTANGSCTIKIPADLPAGKYTLKVFNENNMGGERPSFSSAISDIRLTVNGVFDYPLWVKGVRVNEKNKVNVFNDESRTVKYDSENNKLILNGVNIDDTSQLGIKSDKSLNLYTMGNNSINSKGISIKGDLTLEGSPDCSFSLNSINKLGACLNAQTLNVNSGKTIVEANGNISIDTLNINGGYLKASGSFLGIPIAKINFNSGTIVAKNKGTVAGVISNKFTNNAPEYWWSEDENGDFIESKTTPYSPKVSKFIIITSKAPNDGIFTHNVPNIINGLTDYGKTLKFLEVPEEINDTPVTTINVNAFSGNGKVEKITLPETLTTLESGVFGDCTLLPYVLIPKSCTTIPQNLFGSGETVAIIYKASPTDTTQNIGNLGNKYRYLGDNVKDDILDVNDYQGIVNLALQDTAVEENNITTVVSDINFDKSIDVLDPFTIAKNNYLL